MDRLVPIQSHDNQVIELDYNKLRSVMMILRALNHELRQEILKMLNEQGKMYVTDIYIGLRVDQSVASQHLAILRKAGVVIAKREGKFINYSLNTKKINDIVTFVESLS